MAFYLRLGNKTGNGAGLAGQELPGWPARLQEERINPRFATALALRLFPGCNGAEKGLIAPLNEGWTGSRGAEPGWGGEGGRRAPSPEIIHVLSSDRC